MLPIGGLKEKTHGRLPRTVSHTVLIPKENATDLYEVDAEVKEKIHFIPVERLSQVLKHALIMPGHAAARSAHAMPQATNLIAGEKPVAKDPATVM